MFIVVEHDEFCNMQIVGTSHSHEDARIIMRLAFNNELKKRSKYQLYNKDQIQIGDDSCNIICECSYLASRIQILCVL